MSSSLRQCQRWTDPGRPALLTGTSSEYLGRRPLPTIVRERPIILVLGPAGSGKTSVGLRLAGGDPLYLGSSDVQNALVERVGRRRWARSLVDAPSLVLDGPVWLRSRPAAVEALCELLNARSKRNRRTLVCQDASDGSADTLLGCMPAGIVAIVGLRFPTGKRGRLRFARRMCDELGIPRMLARGTEDLEPWGYAAVKDYLRQLAQQARSEGAG